MSTVPIDVEQTKAEEVEIDESGTPIDADDCNRAADSRDESSAIAAAAPGRRPRRIGRAAAAAAVAAACAVVAVAVAVPLAKSRAGRGGSGGTVAAAAIGGGGTSAESAPRDADDDAVKAWGEGALQNPGGGCETKCPDKAECVQLGAGEFGCRCGKGYFPARFTGDAVAECEPIGIALTSPGHGDFVPAEAGATVVVSGRAMMEDRRNYALTVNGEPATIEPDGSFSASVDLDALGGTVHRAVVAEIMSQVDGFRARDRRVVIAGESVEVAGGGVLAEGVGVRITESAFDRLEPLVERTLAENVDLSNLIPRGTKLLSGHCFQDSFLGCLARGDVTVASFSHSGFDINLDPKAEDVFEVKVSVRKIKVDVKADTNVVDCGLKVAADTAVVSVDFSFRPEQTDATNVDVQMRGDPRVSFSGFSDDVTGGFVCDVLEGLGLVSGVQSLAEKGLRDFVKKAAIDAEIEGVLDEVEIIDPFFAAMGIDAEAPIARISEDQLGITLSHDIALSPAPDANSPSVTGTLLVPQAFPVEELRSPNAQPGVPQYDFALVLSHSVLNWALAALVELGLLSDAFTEIDILGTGDPIELTAPDPSLSLRFRVSPTVPPVTTGAEGPNGELVELNIAQFLVEIISGEDSSDETMWARIAIDAVVAADFVVDGASGEVSLQISPPDPELVRVVLLDNPLGIDEGRLQPTLAPLLARLIPGLLGSFPSFRIPEFLGLAPTVRNISRIGSYVGIFISL